jgi:superfamily I DNA/RNA helicase
MRNYFPQNAQPNSEQLAIINGEPNIIVKGVAGTGKTMTAIYLAAKLSKNHTVAIIVYTKSLKQYIEKSLQNLSVRNVVVRHNYVWDFSKNYDYIIMDELQDFIMKDVNNIKRQAKNGIYFFGDDNQRIYETQPGTNENTVTIDELRNEILFPIIELKSNMRISKTLGNFISAIYPNIFQNTAELDNGIKPIFIKINSQTESLELEYGNTYSLDDIKLFESFPDKNIYNAEEIEKVLRMLNDEEFTNWYHLNIEKAVIDNLNKTKETYLNAITHLLKDELTGHTAILLVTNEGHDGVNLSIKDMYNYFRQKGINNIGYKYNQEEFLCYSDNHSINVMTYHSSKGLEFDNIILPFYIHDRGNLHYVGFTRLRKKLVIIYPEDAGGIHNIGRNLYDERGF